MNKKWWIIVLPGVVLLGGLLLSLWGRQPLFVGIILTLIATAGAFFAAKASREKSALGNQLELSMSLMEASLDGVIMFDEQQKVSYINKAACQVFGYSAEEALGLAVETFVPKRFHRSHKGHMAGFYQGQQLSKRMNERKPVACLRRDGSEFFAETTIAKVQTDKGWIVTAVLRDITERLTREKEDENNRKRLRAVIDTSMDGVITINSNGEVTEFNPAAQKILGYQSAEILGRNIKETIIPSRMRANHEQGMSHYLRTGEHKVLNQRIELPAVHKLGHEVLIEIVITPVTIDRDLLFTAYFRDITRQRRTEQELQDAKTTALAEANKNAMKAEWLSRLLDDAGLVVFGVDSNLTIVFWNGVLERVTGFTAEEVEGLDLVEVAFSPQDGEKVKTMLTQGSSSQENQAERVELKTRSGIPAVVLLGALSEGEGSGVEATVFGFGHVITELAWQQKVLEDVVRRKDTEIATLVKEAEKQV